jgi:threonine dehydratase
MKAHVVNLVVAMPEGRTLQQLLEAVRRTGGEAVVVGHYLLESPDADRGNYQAIATDCASDFVRPISNE